MLINKYGFRFDVLTALDSYFSLCTSSHVSLHWRNDHCKPNRSLCNVIYFRCVVPMTIQLYVIRTCRCSCYQSTELNACHIKAFNFFNSCFQFYSFEADIITTRLTDVENNFENYSNALQDCESIRDHSSIIYIYILFVFNKYCVV